MNARNITSNTYYDWLLDHAFMLVPAQASVGKFLATFKEFPPSQKPASFSIDQVIEQMQEGRHLNKLPRPPVQRSSALHRWSTKRLLVTVRNEVRRAAISLNARRRVVSVRAPLMKRLLVGFLFCLLAVADAAFAADPLPSWNDTEPKRAIVTFVEKVTNEASSDFVPAADRIATFDNDGTLWGEQPMYVQLAFAIDRVKALAPEHPEWKNKQPFKAVLKGD